MAAGRGAGGDDDVDAGLALLDGVVGRADERCDGHAVLVRAFDDIGRGRAKGVHEQADGVLEGDVDVGLAAGRHPTEE